jgi:hypothetical protein
VAAELTEKRRGFFTSGNVEGEDKIAGHGRGVSGGRGRSGRKKTWGCDEAICGSEGREVWRRGSGGATPM